MLSLSKTLNSIKTSLDLINKHSEAQAFSKVRSEITNLYKTIYELQTQTFELQNLYQEAQTKCLQAEDWKNETAPNYKLTELAPGVFVYAFHPVEERDCPSHYLCTNCFLKKRKSILQRTRRDSSGTHYKCPGCGSEICDHVKNTPVTKINRSNPKGWV